jgi:hypothetical protein
MRGEYEMCTRTTLIEGNNRTRAWLHTMNLITEYQAEIEGIL